MKKLLSKALAVWNWVWKDYDPKETVWMLIGGCIYCVVGGKLSEGLGLLLGAACFAAPKFTRWLKNELLTEAERAEIESNAHSMGIELQGKVYLTFSDEQGKVVLRDQLDSKVMLEAMQATMTHAIREEAARLQDESIT